MNAARLRLFLERLYVTVMMHIIGRSLVATSKVDAPMQQELLGFPTGYQIQMVVLPAGPGFVVQSNGDGTLRRGKALQTPPDLSIRFKHLSHAFLVLSFQESTARAFANDRMVANGDVSHAIRLVRCLNGMEALILPRWVASRAVKRYPDLPLSVKLPRALRIYGQVALGLFTGK